MHDAGSFTTAGFATLTQLRMRMGRTATASPGFQLECELWLARSPNDSTTAHAVFADNAAAGTEVNVLVRKTIALPVVPNLGWSVAPFVFDAPFAWTGSHLSWRVAIWSNSNASVFVPYELDATADLAATGWIGLGCTHAYAIQGATLTSSLSRPGATTTFDALSMSAAEPAARPSQPHGTRAVSIR